MKQKINSLQWWIVGLLALAMALNYLDRQSLSVIVSKIQADIPLDNLAYSHLQSYFFFGYGLMYAGGGFLVDRVGTRWGYLVVIVWWSVATALHGFTRNVTELSIARALLGLGEGGSFPAATKVVSERFSSNQRSFAVGIFNTGSSAGAMIAAPAIAILVSFVHWRTLFFIAGGLGLLWAVLWLWTVPSPSSHSAYNGPPRPSWISLFQYREVKGLLISKFMSDSAWFFLMMWLPRYLGDVRGLQISAIGYYGWIPFAFAALGSFCGGWLSAFLIERGMSIDHSRKSTLLFAACLLPASLFIVFVPLSWAIVMFSIASFGHQFWATILQTIPTDLFPSETVGSVAGLMGASGAFGGTAFNFLAGILIQRYHSYLPVFTIAGLLHLISFVVIAFMIRPIVCLDKPTIFSEPAVLGR